MHDKINLEFVEDITEGILVMRAGFTVNEVFLSGVVVTLLGIRRNDGIAFLQKAGTDMISEQPAAAGHKNGCHNNQSFL